MKRKFQVVVVILTNFKVLVIQSLAKHSSRRDPYSFLGWRRSVGDEGLVLGDIAKCLFPFSQAAPGWEEKLVWSDWAVMEGSSRSWRALSAVSSKVKIFRGPSPMKTDNVAGYNNRNCILRRWRLEQIPLKECHRFATSAEKPSRRSILKPLISGAWSFWVMPVVCLFYHWNLGTS